MELIDRKNLEACFKKGLYQPEPRLSGGCLSQKLQAVRGAATMSNSAVRRGKKVAQRGTILIDIETHDGRFRDLLSPW